MTPEQSMRIYPAVIKQDELRLNFDAVSEWNE